MGREVIRLGDYTSHGGRVIEATARMIIDGIPVALWGDHCSCPIPGHDNCVICEGEVNAMFDGRPVALEGHKTSCNATVFPASKGRCESVPLVNALGPMDSGRSHIVPAMNIHEPDSALPRSNQRAIDALKPIAENEQGKRDDVLVMIWSWKNLGFVGPGQHSVGHVAAAVQDKRGEWEIVQSQFPHGPGEPSQITGPNTTIADPAILRMEEGNRLPNAAFLVTLPNIGAYAKEAICDLRKPTWNCDPRWVVSHVADTETNCTYGTIKALRAGGASFPGLFASKHLTPGGPWLPNDLRIYLEDEIAFNVRRETDPSEDQWFVHDGMPLMRSLSWGEGALTV